MISLSTKTVRLFATLALGTSVLAGCSETSFKDAFDMGKVAPDETQVQANRTLTMPPDLQLRAPDGTVANPQVAGNQPPAYAQPPVNTQPPQYGAVYQPGAQPKYKAQPQQQAQIPQVQQPAPRRQDIYERHGISRTHPDGRQKTQAELIEELRIIKKKRQQAQNPNYGTVFNLPKVWSDGG